MLKWVARHQPEAHLILSILWTISIVPTLLWWKESILWVAFMSLWANIVSHLGAYAAAKAARKARTKEG